MQIGFPFHFEYGRVATADNDDYVRQLIAQVLFTMPGQRVNRPQFGCGAAMLVFEPDSSQLAAATQHMLAAQIERYLGDVLQVQGITVSNDGDTVAILVSYVNRLNGIATTARLTP